jgi:sugar-specific transcriptional regulator TrmB
MVVEKTFIDKLKIFGLNSYEAKLWAALLSRGKAGAGELAEVSGVPRSRSYDVLQSLEEKGFILGTSKKPIEYTAVPPTEVVERIKSKIDEETKLNFKDLKELQDSKLLSNLNELHSKGFENIESLDMCGSIKSRENIHHHLSMMIKEAQKSIHIMGDPESITEKYEILGDLLNNAKKKGINLSFTISEKTPETVIKGLKKLGNVKYSNSLCRLCITDDTQTMFMLKDIKDVHKNYDVGVWVNTPYFSKNLINLMS